MNILDKLILFLFIIKSFNEETAYDIHKRINLRDLELYVETTKDNKLYLTTKGKFKAHGIINSLKTDILDYN